MKVLIVNPPPYEIIEPRYDQPEFPRAALACLAAYLREREVDVHVLDCKFDRLNSDDTREFIRKLRPDVVGCTALTNEIMQAAIIATLTKEIDPKIKTIIGGNHLSFLPERTLREFPQFNFGVVGEGEETFFEMLQNINDEDALGEIPGVCFINSKDTYQFGGERSKIFDQDSLPLPAWDMFRPGGEYFIQSLRGCPFACNFCSNPNGRAVRARSAENVVEEIRWLVENMQPKAINFGDEIFTVSRERTVDICNGLIDSGLSKKLNWTFNTHVRCIDLELAKLIKKANCSLVALGIESGDDEKLKYMKKGTNVKVINEAIEALKEVKLPYRTQFILGQPNETMASVLETINFMVKLNSPQPVLGIMVPYPGTQIAEMVERGEGGYIYQAKDWNDYNKQFGGAISLKGLSRGTLELLLIWAYIKLFVWNFRFLGLIKFVWQFRNEGMALIKKQLIGLVSKPDPSTMTPP